VPAVAGTLRRWLRDDALRAALPAWLLARLAVGLGFAVALVAADELVPGHRPVQLGQGLFAWDAAFYRDIADLGYGGVAREGLRFFPLLPVLARVVAVPLFGNVGLALLLLVNAAALVAGVLLYRLAVHETGDRRVGERAAWFLALLPPAAVLVLGYAEALLLVCSIGAFLAYRKERWWAAVALGLLAGLCRPVGAALALPALLEAWPGWRQHRSATVARLAAIAAPVVGTGIYLVWVQRTYGDWQLPLRLQNDPQLRGGWANPVSTVWDSVHALVSGGSLGEGLHLPWIGLYLVLLVICFRRLPASYGAYAGALLLGALTGHTLGSFERYGLAAFPLLLALAITLHPPSLERAAHLACAAGLTGFTTLLFLNAFVP
jgi:hypothetical protein